MINPFLGRLFRADYLTSRGKWIHLGKLLTVIFVPILGAWVFTLYSLADNVIQKDATVEVRVHAAVLFLVCQVSCKFWSFSPFSNLFVLYSYLGT